MIERLWRFLRGYVVLKVRGPQLERFLNRAARAGVPLWDVERLSAGMLVARTAVSSFSRVRRLKLRGWRIGVVQKVGLPFAAAALARRKGLVAGACLALLALYVASGYVWFVAVEGDDDLPIPRLLEVAAGAGLRPGVRWDAVDRHEVQRALLLEIDELSWAAVKIQGTRSIIEARRRAGLDPTQSAPGDIVAARDGIVEQVMAIAGHPRVAKGDTVRRGDVLISGFIPPEEPQHRELVEAGRPPYVRADGIVTARVWYEGAALVPLVQHSEEPTGARAWGVELELGGARLRLGGPPRAFAAYRASARAWEGGVGSRTFALRWISYEEVQRRRTELSVRDAEEEARRAARAQLEAELAGRAVVGGPFETVEIVFDEGAPAVLVTVRAEAITDVAAFKEIQF